MVMATRQKQLGLTGIAGNTLIKVRTTPSPLARSHTNQKQGLVIGGQWKITTDELNVTIFSHHGNRWQPEAYVSTLSAAYTWLINQEVRKSDLSDLKVVVARIEQLKREIIGIAG